MASVFLLLACAILAVAAMLLLGALVPHGGIPAGPPGAGGPDGLLRNWLEVAYFATSAALPLIAVGALLFARRQANHARRQNEIAANAARAESYLMLFREERPKIAAGVQLCQMIEQDFDRLAPAQRGAGGLPGFARRRLAEMEAQGDPFYEDVFELLTTLENLGLLTHRRYVSFEDLHAMLEGALDYIATVLLGHAEDRQRASPDGRECQYAVWLMRKVRTYEPRRGPDPAAVMP